MNKLPLWIQKTYFIPIKIVTKSQFLGQFRENSRISALGTKKHDSPVQRGISNYQRLTNVHSFH